MSGLHVQVTGCMCALQKAVGRLGGRSAAVDGARAIELILGPPLTDDKAAAAAERKLSDATHAAFAAAGGVESLLLSLIHI